MTSPPPIAPAPLAATATALSAGTLEVADHLARAASLIERVDPAVRAFLPEPDRPARLSRDAAALEARWGDPAARPPHYGVAVGVKDVLRVDGLLTRAGSRLPPDLLAGPEAAAVRLLRAAGAVVLGKTAMDEFAYAEPPPTRNPHDLAHRPSGSSGGSAAAVAAERWPLALGTQTSRSVIGPAAPCGIVGFKPTFGRVPTDGVVSRAPSFDTVGLFTQDVEGMTLAAASLVTDWRPDRASSSPTLGVPDGKLLSWALNEGGQAFEAHVECLVRSGYEARRVPFFSDDELEEMDRRAMLLLHGEMARVHAACFARYAERYRPRTARAIRGGQAVADDSLAACRTQQRLLGERVEGLMLESGIDLWVTPASAGPAPRGLDVTGWGGMMTAWSYAGIPCVAVPAGRAASGLPLGLQCAAAPEVDERLLAWARGIEAALAADVPR